VLPVFVAYAPETDPSGRLSNLARSQCCLPQAYLSSSQKPLKLRLHGKLRDIVGNPLPIHICGDIQEEPIQPARIWLPDELNCQEICIALKAFKSNYFGWLVFEECLELALKDLEQLKPQD